ncbi:MAG TPA: hypothetical protein VMW27_27440 [Thermoanaerobaculia bacterium]|nr:hypothetical protein [Thermoanaerobaculia bacterium]
MSIRDFYSNFVAVNPENALFVALRKLSQLEDAQSLLTQDEDQVLGWGDWTATAIPATAS